MEYGKVFKHCKKVVDKGDVTGFRAVLKGVFHSDNKVIATDGKRLLIAEIDNAKFSNVLVDAKTGELQEGRYPDTNKLLLSEASDIQLDINKKTLEDIKRVLRRIKKAGFKYIELKLESEDKKHVWYVQPKPSPDINITDFDKTELRFALAEDERRKDQKKTFDIRYFINAMDFVKDNKRAGTKLMMTESNTTAIQFTNQVDEDFKYKYLVMPMRNF
ncbi:hypothetical protein [Staphylococcus equorum]|uniref:DNA polymerase III beta sliding clamp C-terminal domain-containing protein n=1 Tax=Staphylococcus equorum TaxID=246432 RepID=A0AAP7IGB5_9STAP|nr:hypothetical protein [Staphylococcus equorum]OEK59119.1 hypothetical protein ASS94_00195 [Staphylococcus equorum]